MEKKFELILRGSFIFLALFLILFFLYKIYSNFFDLISQTSFIVDFNYSIFIIYIILIFISYLILNIGIYWSNYFKFLTKITISFSIIFLIISSFSILVNINSENISDSIQDSIDYILASSLEEILLNQIDLIDEPLKISVLEDTQNINIIEIYNNNITNSQVNLIIDLFENKPYSFQEEVAISKLIVTTIYDEIFSNIDDSDDLEFSVTIHDLEQIVMEIENSIDISILRLEQINTFYEINENAYIKLNLINSENKILNFDLQNPNEKDLDLIWKNLDFNENVSYNTKKIILQIFFSQMQKELPEFEDDIEDIISDIVIPIEQISPMIPEQIRDYTKYDIFSNDLDVRINELNLIRDDCNEIEINNRDDLCFFINMTEQENLIQFLSNQSNEMEDVLPAIIFEDIQTKQGVENLISQKTKKGYIFLILGIILFLLSFIFYYFNFKIFNRELVKIHIPYFVFKTAFYHFLPSYIITLIFYIIIKGDFILNAFNQNFSEFSFIFSSFFSIPTVVLLFEIFDTFFIILTLLLLFFMFGYIFLYILLKKKLENLSN